MTATERPISSGEGPPEGDRGREDGPPCPPADLLGEAVKRAIADVPEVLKNDAKSAEEDPHFTKMLICNPPGRESIEAPRRYIMRDGLGERVVKLLLEGKNPSTVARILGITPALEKYHRDKATRDRAIIRVEGSYPHRYKKGPKYREGLYKKRKGRRSSKFVIPEARVHLGNGAGFRFEVLRFGDLHALKLPEGERSLFPRDPVGKKGEKHYSAAFLLPAAIMGRDGEAATLSFFPAPDRNEGGGRLDISPPELLLDLDRLQAEKGPDPFRPLVDHITGTLSRFGGWRFGENTRQGEEVHYAFSRSMVEPLLPGLMDAPEVHILRRGDNEPDLPLFRDLSTPEGELETTYQGIARDLLALLTVEYHKKTGRR